MKKHIGMLAVILAILSQPLIVFATILTYHFEGYFASDSSIGKQNDTIEGYYTIDTSRPLSPHPDSYIDLHGEVGAIILPRLGWEIQIHHSASGVERLSSETVIISIGNDTKFGDLFFVQLVGDANTVLPDGSKFRELWIRLEDPTAFGADMLSSTNLNTPPIFSLAQSSFGLFRTDSAAYDLFITEHSVAAIPEPATIFLFGAGLVGVVCGARKRKRASALILDTGDK